MREVYIYVIGNNSSKRLIGSVRFRFWISQELYSFLFKVWYLHRGNIVISLTARQTGYRSVIKAQYKEVNDNFSVHGEKAEFSYTFVHLYLNPEGNFMIS